MDTTSFTDKNSKKEDDIYFGNSRLESYSMRAHNHALDKVIEEAVSEAKRAGGNGMINFHYEPVFNKSGLQEGWEVRGMVIKK